MSAASAALMNFDSAAASSSGSTSVSRLHVASGCHDVAALGGKVSEVLMDAVKLLDEYNARSLPRGLKSSLLAAARGADSMVESLKTSGGKLGGSGALYASRRRAAERRRKSGGGGKKRSALRELQVALEGENGSSNTNVGKARKKPAKKARKSPAVPAYPPPANGNQYMRVEVAKLLAAWPKDGTRQLVINDMVERKLVPVVGSRLRILAGKARNGQLIREWSCSSREALATEDELLAIRRKFQEAGRSLGPKELAKELEELAEAKLTARGLANVGESAKPCSKTIGNYMAYIASEPDIRMTEAAVSKSERRYTAERSILAALGLIHVTAATHYLPLSEPPPWFDPSINDELRGLVELALGVPVYPIHPCMITSTDEQTMVVFQSEGGKRGGSRAEWGYRFPTEAEAKAESTWRLASANDKGTTRAVFKLGPSSFMDCMRVKINWCFSGAGNAAAPWVLVTGLAERELNPILCPSGVLLLEVPGLCAGSATDLRNNAVGYVCLIRTSAKGAKGESPEEIAAHLHEEKVQRPFVEANRVAFLGHTRGSPVLPYMQSAEWLDGGHAYLNAATSEGFLSSAEAEKRVKVKGNPARTGTEQDADLNAVFPNMNAQEKSTRKAVPPGSLPLLRCLRDAFKEQAQKGILHMAPKKQAALLDFLARLPQAISKAATPRNIIKGPLESGRLDRETQTHPCLLGMLATLRRPVLIEELALVRKTFISVFRRVLDTGCLPSDDELVELGFTPDTDSKGLVVQRNAKITNEPAQRSKVLSAMFQRGLRMQLITDAMAAKAAKEAKSELSVTNLLRDSKECEELFFAALGKPPSSGLRMLNHLTLEQVAAVKTGLLKSFVHVREYAVAKKPRVGSLPTVNKGTVALAKDGTDCLVLRAWNRRCSKVLLKSRGPVVVPPVVEHPPLVMRIGADGGGGTMVRSADRSPASIMLASKNWTKLVCASIHGSNSLSLLSSDGGQGELADLLAKLVRTRLVVHKNTKIHEAEKRKHWSLVWFEENVNRVAAMVVLYNHVQEDLACCDADSSLLQHPGDVFQQAESGGGASEHEGSYLFYDRKRMAWIRSGKVDGVGRTIGQRFKEHAKCALLDDAASRSSRFYTTFPRKESTRYTDAVRKGWFEDLRIYEALGFERKDKKAVKALCDPRKSGLLIWPKEVLTRVGKLGFAGSLTLEDRQLHMVGYLFELFYDLMLAPRHNISRSPGFELPLGIFGGVSE